METDKFLGLPNDKSNLSKYENLYISSSVYTGLHYSKFQFYLFIKKRFWGISFDWHSLKILKPTFLPLLMLIYVTVNFDLTIRF